MTKKSLRALSLVLTLTLIVSVISLNFGTKTSAEDILTTVYSQDFNASLAIAHDNGGIPDPGQWNSTKAGPIAVDTDSNIFVDSTVGRGGSGGSLKVVADPTDGKSGAYYAYTSRSDLVAGATYRYSGWIKTENIEQAGAGDGDHGAALTVEAFAAGDYSTAWNTKTTTAKYGNTDWTQVSIDFVAPANYPRIRIGGRIGWCVGTAWFDDLTLSKVEESLSSPYSIDFETVPTVHNDNGSVVPVGEFGTWTNQNPMDWTNMKVVTNMGHDGSSNSFYINATANDCVYNAMTALTNLLPGKTYKVSAWVKTNNLVRANTDNTEQGALLRAEAFGAADLTDRFSPAKFTTGVHMTNDWKKLELQFVVPDGAARVRFNFQVMSCVGEAWFDDLLVELVEDAVVPTTTEIVNGSFEDTFNFKPDAGVMQDVIGIWGGWTNQGAMNWDTQISIDNTVSRTGTNSLKVIAQSNAAVYSQRQSVVAVEPSTMYRAIVYAKTQDVVRVRPDASDAGAYLQVEYFKNLDNSSQIATNPDVKTSAIAGNNDWTRLQLVFTTPAETSYIRFNANVTSCVGTVWFDDASIEKLEEEPPLIEEIYDPNFTATESLVYDAGAFEKVLEAWGVWSNQNPIDYTQQFMLSDEGRDGGRSVKIVAGDPDSNSVYSLRTAIEGLVPYVGYRLTCYVKTEDIVAKDPTATEQGAYLQVMYYDDNVTYVPTDADVKTTAIVGTNGWTQLILDFTPPTDATKILINANLTTCSGTAYFTDFALAPYTPEESSGGESKPESQTDSKTDSTTSGTSDSDPYNNGGGNGEGGNLQAGSSTPVFMVVSVILLAGAAVMVLRKRKVSSI